MSDKQGPALTPTVQEVQAHFQTDDQLQVALGELGLAGFDRADFSLPEDQPGRSVQTADEGAENPVDDIDKAQLRTMGTGMAGYAGAAAVAGVTLATGGAAAVAAAAALAVGVGGALVANAAGQAADRVSSEDRNERGQAGTLILAVRTAKPGQAEKASGILKAAGATSVQTVTRGEDMLTAGVSAASWTG